MARKEFRYIAGGAEIRVHALRSEDNFFRSSRIAQDDIGGDCVVRNRNLDAFAYHHKAQNFVDEGEFSVLRIFDRSARKQSTARI